MRQPCVKCNRGGVKKLARGAITLWLSDQASASKSKDFLEVVGCRLHFQHRALSESLSFCWCRMTKVNLRRRSAQSHLQLSIHGARPDFLLRKRKQSLLQHTPSSSGQCTPPILLHPPITIASLHPTPYHSEVAPSRHVHSRASGSSISWPRSARGRHIQRPYHESHHSDP